MLNAHKLKSTSKKELGAGSDIQGKVTPSLRVQGQSSSKGTNVELDNSEPEMCHYLSHRS